MMDQIVDVEVAALIGRAGIALMNATEIELLVGLRNHNQNPEVAELLKEEEFS